MILEKETPSRYVPLDTVKNSYQDFVCYNGMDKENCLQVYWYEFFNENLNEDQRNIGFQRLNDAKSIISPHLFTIFEVQKISNPPRFVVVTEAIESPTLAEYIRSLEMEPPYKVVIKWFKCLVIAVQALHSSQNKVVHGSINLHNVFFRQNPSNLKLLMPLSSMSCRNIPPFALDIDCYKAPELIQGFVSRSNDIWSLGMVLIELLTRETPYNEKKSPFELMRAMFSFEYPLSMQKIENSNAKDLIRKCLCPYEQRLNIDEILTHPVFLENDQLPFEQNLILL